MAVDFDKNVVAVMRLIVPIKKSFESSVTATTTFSEEQLEGLSPFS